MDAVTIASTDEILDGTMKGFTTGGKQVLVANVNGKFYAMKAVCSHMSGYLPAGELNGNVVTCPVHHAQFDVITGKVHRNVNPVFRIPTKGRGATDLPAYEVEVTGNEVRVKI